MPPTAGRPAEPDGGVDEDGRVLVVVRAPAGGNLTFGTGHLELSAVLTQQPGLDELRPGDGCANPLGLLPDHGQVDLAGPRGNLSSRAASASAYISRSSKVRSVIAA